MSTQSNNPTQFHHDRRRRQLYSSFSHTLANRINALHRIRPPLSSAHLRGIISFPFVHLELIKVPHNIDQSSLIPIARQPFNQVIASAQHLRDFLGPCDVICSSCHALHWIDEHTYDSGIRNPRFSRCCHNGKISLPPFNNAPEPLHS